MANIYVCTDCGHEMARRFVVCDTCKSRNLVFGGNLTSAELGRFKNKPKTQGNQLQNMLVMALALTAIFYACQFALNPIKKQLSASQNLGASLH